MSEHREIRDVDDETGQEFFICAACMEDWPCRYGRLQIDRDEARAQLAAATARVAVLEAALEGVLDDADKMDGWAHLTSLQIRTLAADLDPLAAAVTRVVAAAFWCRDGGEEDAQMALDAAIDALHTLAPWWGTVSAIPMPDSWPS